MISTQPAVNGANSSSVPYKQQRWHLRSFSIGSAFDRLPFIPHREDSGKVVDKSDRTSPSRSLCAVLCNCTETWELTKASKLIR
uniref:Uncharacterized protein n=1 Tax=Physcomitrium patens TaxID=3218 RepID=A0A7I4FT40_PHYPA